MAVRELLSKYETLPKVLWCLYHISSFHCSAAVATITQAHWLQKPAHVGVSRVTTYIIFKNELIKWISVYHPALLLLHLLNMYFKHLGPHARIAPMKRLVLNCQVQIILVNLMWFILRYKWNLWVFQICRTCDEWSRCVIPVMNRYGRFGPLIHVLQWLNLNEF